ncbi:hypothetical protein C1645_771841 [Glomus cerebriforme]|uniref:Uncharacterized protein n=1 Tax=Glomus cerebriforme TaxID=658196 RepID=A0A397SU23_9GLOM|nr:hypothetical protein C1645_771841 [Glomus cerebriforme]
MWVSVEVELKVKKLTDLQLHGLLQATQESQNYASTLNRGALNRLEDVIDSNKHKSEPIDLKRKMTESDVPQAPRKKGPHVSFSAISPHKPLLTKETMANLAPTIIPGLKSLVSNLEVQHEDIVEEIMRHSRDQIKLVSLPESVVAWLRFILASTVVDRIVLIEISVHKSGFKAVEVRSARWLFSWNSVVEYMHSNSTNLILRNEDLFTASSHNDNVVSSFNCVRTCLYSVH